MLVAADMDYFWTIVKLVGFWVALMSGTLSIIREFLVLHHADKIPQKSVFWSCVRIAFVLSASLTWYGEHRDLKQANAVIAQKQEELQNLSNPKLVGDIETLGVAQMSPYGKQLRVFNYTGPLKDMPVVLVWATIRNLGADSDCGQVQPRYSTKRWFSHVRQIHECGSDNDFQGLRHRDASY
jgi:hypothetical protein